MIPPVISREDVVEYLRVHQEAGKLEKRQKELRELLLPALVAGATTPKDLPYRLVNRPQNKSTLSWKDICLKILKTILGSKAKATAEMERIESRAKKKPIPSLCVEINPDYAQQLGQEKPE